MEPKNRNMNNKPIGVFDSGLGGLTIWRELYGALPGESLIYYGDGLNCPYGSKSPEEILKLTDAALEWMSERDIKLAVIACNTATMAAIDYLRGKYAFPIVGVEPAVKPAAISTKSRVVAILATENSLKGELYTRTAETYGKDVTLIPVNARKFVELVERDMEESAEAYEAVRDVVEPLIERGADRLVLGCTHYPFLRPAMEKVIGGRDVEIVDSAPAIVRRVSHLLEQHGIAASPEHAPQYEFFTLADEAYLRRMKVKSGLPNV